MNLALVLLLAGLIVIGMAIPTVVLPRDAKSSIGAKVQMFFGIVLVALFLLANAGIVHLQ